MSDNIAKLSVMLAADTAQFDAALQASSAKLQQTAAAMGHGITGGDLQKALDAQAAMVKRQKIKDWVDAPRLAAEAAAARQQAVGGAISGAAQTAVGGLGLGPISGMLGLDKIAGMLPPINAMTVAILAAATAAVALAEAGRRSLKELDQIRKMYGLTGEAAAGFRLAVTNAGMTMEEARMPLGRIVKALGEAGGGSAEAQRMFRQLGVDGLALSRLPLDQSLAALSRRFREITDPGQKAAAAAKLFGRNWQDALKLLERMADQEKFKRIAGNFGAVASAADMKQFERNKESGLDLSTNAAAARQGITQQLFLAMEPAITFVQDLGTRALEILGTAMPVIGQMIKLALLPLNALIALIEGVAEVVQPVWEEILSVFSEIGKLVTEIFGQGEGGLLGLIKQIGAWIVRLTPIFWGIKAIVGFIKLVVDGVIAGIKTAQSVLSTVTFGAVSGPSKGAAGPSAVSAERAAHLSQLREEMRQSIDTLQAQTAAVGRASNAMQIYQLRQRGAAAIMESQRPTIDNFNQMMMNLVPTVQRNRTAIQGLQEAHASLQWTQANQALRDQAAQLTMTSNEWQMFQLRIQGVTESMLEQTRVFQQRRDILQTFNQLLTEDRHPGAGIQAGSREAMMAVQANQRAGERDDIPALMRSAVEEARDTRVAQESFFAEVRAAMRETPQFIDVMGPQRS